MHIHETANGNYAIRQTPVLHWFVVLLLIAISAIGYINGAPLWMRIILCVIIFAMLVRNSSFSITTDFLASEHTIRTQHRKLFGVKRREVDFSAVSKVDFAIEHWGRLRQTPRANLTLWTLDSDMDDDIIEVFVLANPQEGQMVADRINQILAPFLPPPVPESASVPAWFGNEAPVLLAELCRAHSSETCFFVAAADLNEVRREAVFREMSLPTDEHIIAFLDLTEAKDGDRGLVIGHGGLYWKNGFFTGSKSTWISWDAFVNAEVSTDPTDADVWIAPSIQIGLGDTSRQAPVHGLLIESQRVLRSLRDQQA
ncbi:MAG: hypothetical protein QGH25_06770 [Candidatus Latescibacteria bacterium]|nr:hypothetical protein [Candidatus Latescibacterota bacterium]